MTRGGRGRGRGRGRGGRRGGRGGGSRQRRDSSQVKADTDTDTVEVSFDKNPQEYFTGKVTVEQHYNGQNENRTYAVFGDHGGAEGERGRSSPE